MNAAEIESLLCEKAEEVVRHLLPLARFAHGEAKIGSIQGEAGESLSIRISGSKVGSWGEFNGGDLKGKRLIGLWHAVRGHSQEDFPKTLAEAAKWLGVYNPDAKDFKSAPRPTPLPVKVESKPVRPGTAVYSYLTMERELSAKVLEVYQIGEDAKSEVIFFPFRSEDDSRLQMGKFLPLRRDDGKKQPWTTPNAQKCLFGKHAINVAEGDLYITEGEIDAMSLWDMGYPAVSVPYGAKFEGKDGKDPNDEWIANDFEWLQCFTRIFLCLDADEQGQKAAASISKRLGRERCFLVGMPDGCKDANDALVKGLKAELFDAIESAKTADPVELKNAWEFRDQVWERFNPETKQERGIPFFLDIPWRNRNGEVTIWTGFSGSGKSTMLCFYMVYLASLGEKSCIASFEMPTTSTLHTMTLQAAGKIGFVDNSEFLKDYEWLSGMVWLVDRIGRFHWRDLFEIFKYARRRYGIRQFVVDSLMRVGIAEEDYQGQKDFMEAAANFSMEHECHIHVVAHPNKRLEDETKPPGKRDVSGSAHITNAASNGVTVFRNKAKEEKIYDLKISGQQPGIEISSMPDGYFNVWKQREEGDEPKCAFWFVKHVRQFAKSRDLSMRFVRHPNEEKNYG